MRLTEWGRRAVSGFLSEHGYDDAAIEACIRDLERIAAVSDPGDDVSAWLRCCGEKHRVTVVSIMLEPDP